MHIVVMSGLRDVISGWSLFPMNDDDIPINVPEIKIFLSLIVGDKLMN
jgi:hypothetical protein